MLFTITFFYWLWWLLHVFFVFACFCNQAFWLQYYLSWFSWPWMHWRWTFALPCNPFSGFDCKIIISNISCRDTDYMAAIWRKLAIRMCFRPNQRHILRSLFATYSALGSVQTPDGFRRLWSSNLLTISTPCYRVTRVAERTFVPAYPVNESRALGSPNFILSRLTFIWINGVRLHFCPPSPVSAELRALLPISAWQRVEHSSRPLAVPEVWPTDNSEMSEVGVWQKNRFDKFPKFQSVICGCQNWLSPQLKSGFLLSSGIESPKSRSLVLRNEGYSPQMDILPLPMPNKKSNSYFIDSRESLCWRTNGLQISSLH